jgi:hypothetical protein
MINLKKDREGHPVEEDVQQFIGNLEARFDGPVGYRTYSTWFASDDGLIREYGVFLYEINGILHFEDFERKPSILGFSLKPSKKQKPYEKMERSFALEDIRNIDIVARSAAQSVAQGVKPVDSIAPATLLQKLVSRLVTRVELQDGPTYFFELINYKTFVQAVKEGTHGRV